MTENNSKAHTAVTMSIQCLNCGYSFSSLYCPECGQKSTVGKLTISRLLYDVPHAVFHLNSGFLFNFYYLLTVPGQAIRNYLAGKRKKFFHPATFLILSLVINYLIVKMYNLHFYDAEELSTMSPVKAKAIKDYDSMQWWFLEHTYLYILIAIPLSALYLTLLFKLLKQNINTAEAAVVVLFVIAEGVLIQSSLYLLCGWVKSGPLIRTVESVNIVLLITYASFAVYQVIIHQSMFKKGIVSLLAGIGLAAIWVASGFLLYMNWN